jgi:hypothetical protein
MLDPKRLRPLRFYLDKVIDSNVKIRVSKKFKEICSMHLEFDLESADYYRYLGVQVIRLQLLHDVNRLIMDHIGRSTYLLPWARELWEFKVLYEELIKTTQEMLRSLLAHGISDGHYRAGDTESKTTTAADAGGSNEGSMVQPQPASQEAL